MKKAIGLIICIIIIAFAIVILLHTDNGIAQIVDLGFADTITLSYEGVQIQITDLQDFQAIKRLCSGFATRELGVPACGFFGSQFSFEGGGKNITVFAGCDKCGTMMLGRSEKASLYYSISQDALSELESIVNKYGAKIYCV